MNYYFCTCGGIEQEKPATSESDRLYKTEIKGDGICKKCGYYAVTLPFEDASVWQHKLGITGMEVDKNDVGIFGEEHRVLE